MELITVFGDRGNKRSLTVLKTFKATFYLSEIVSCNDE